MKNSRRRNAALTAQGNETFPDTKANEQESPGTELQKRYDEAGSPKQPGRHPKIPVSFNA
jgi:hypothetical protein